MSEASPNGGDEWELCKLMDLPELFRRVEECATEHKESTYVKMCITLLHSNVQLSLRD